MLHGSKMLVGKGLVRDVYVAAYMNTIVVLKVLQEQEDPSKRKAALHLHKKEALVLNEVGLEYYRLPVLLGYVCSASMCVRTVS